MRAIVHESIAELAPDEWDALAAPQSLYLTHAWLAQVEASGRAPLCRYVVVRDDGGLLGAIPCYPFESPPSWLYDPNAVFEGLSKHVGGWFPGLLAGGCSEFRGGLLLADGPTEAQVAAMLLDAVRELAQGRSVQFHYLPRTAARRIANALDIVPEAVMLEDVDHVLVVRDTTLDAWVQTLPKGRRDNVRRELRAFAASGATIEIVPLRDAPLDVLAQLHANLMRKYGHDEDSQDERRSLERAAERFGDDAIAFLARDGSAVGGFALCYAHGKQLYLRTAGFDYESEIPFVYGNVMFYAPLAYAMERGLAAIQLGLSTNEAKLLRGADAVPLFAVLLPADGADPNFQRVAADLSARRTDDFWARFGRYALHQTRADLEFAAPAEGSSGGAPH